ncbi:MAG: adenine phosphoribosyltransferase [Rhabdochlamydiaceae bacterium]
MTTVQNRPRPTVAELRSKLRVIPGWPKQGVNFVDITTLLKDASAFRAVVDILTEHFSTKNIDAIVAIEARGLILGAPIAYNLGIGFVPARKKGKLPAEKYTVEYTLEYGAEFVEMHIDGLSAGQRVAIIDDLLATGGTAEATAKLVEKLGGVVAGFGFLIQLDFLQGKDRIKKYDILSLVHFDE